MATADRTITGAHVRWAMIAFFAVIIGLDTLFIVFAIRSHPGEEVKNSYVLGLDYNNQLARREAQRALGWTASAGLDDDETTFLVDLKDADGAPLPGLHVAIQTHLAGAQKDGATLELAGSGAGQYSVALPLEGPGRVVVAISVRRTESGPVVFEATKTLNLS